MSGEFDVFDEWGNYVGKFTPAVGGGFLSVIAMVILWTVGFLAYLLIRLVAKVFEGVGKKKWSSTATFLGVLAATGLGMTWAYILLSAIWETRGLISPGEWIMVLLCFSSPLGLLLLPVVWLKDRFKRRQEEH